MKPSNICRYLLFGFRKENVVWFIDGFLPGVVLNSPTWFLSIPFKTCHWPMRVFPICVNLNIFNSVDIRNIRYITYIQRVISSVISSVLREVQKIIVALPAAMFAEDYYISIISKTQFALHCVLNPQHHVCSDASVFFYSQKIFHIC